MGYEDSEDQRGGIIRESETVSKNVAIFSLFMKG